ncbi:hypothetical protein B566_EDAN002816 [Ephemera danica]|nr:hypothetical protein B566_EDAN002816 [Ephemera danica]
MRGVQPLRELPSVPIIVVQCMFMFICYDFSIYYAHRSVTCHRCVHHEWTSPIGITAYYCHPVEHLVSNTGPPVLGVLILGAHVDLGLIRHLAWCELAHGFNTNYGVLGLIDWLHGTDNAYRKRRRAAAAK